jgi:hypothetical protein
VQRYPVRASSRARLASGPLEALCREVFGGATVDGEKVHASFGALASLVVWPLGKELAVDVTMDPKVEAEVAAETVRRYNRFLQEATGYSAKERASRLRKSATHPAGGE